MRVRIRGGTVNHGEPPLCATCRYSIIARGHRTLGEEVGFCGRMPFGDRRIRFPVTSCTEYSDLRQPTLWHMEQIGWVLRSDPKRNTIGFVEARKLEDDEKHVIEEDLGNGPGPPGDRRARTRSAAVPRTATAAARW